MLLLALIISSLYASSSLPGQQAGSIRLWNNGIISSSQTSGRVQVFYNSQWMNICRSASFSSVEADVICHQLGYTGSSSWSYAAIDSYETNTATNTTVIGDVSCFTHQYLTLFQCTLSTSTSCSDDNVVGVSCYTTRIWDNPYNGQIRLTGGSYSNEGLLEIYCNGQWGTVCNDSFSSIDADAACKQLGYSSSHLYDYNSTLRGNSSQPIWLDDVECSSSDTCLTSCQNCLGSESYNCGHSEDVTIQCNNSLSSSNQITVESCMSSINLSAIIVSGIAFNVIIFSFALLLILAGINIHRQYWQYKKGTIHRFGKRSNFKWAIIKIVRRATTTNTTTTTTTAGIDTTSNTTTTTTTAGIDTTSNTTPFNPSIPTAPPAATIQYECNNDTQSPLPTTTSADGTFVTDIGGLDTLEEPPLEEPSPNAPNLFYNN